MKNIFGKIKKQVEVLSLDLTGKVVLTEAATGPYMVTPIIAAVAGAEVFAFCKDTKYGSVKQVFETYTNLFKEWDIKPNIKFIDTLDEAVINRADIITNSGHLRPLSAEKLHYIKNKAVIPLMYESWELRGEDLDLEFCRKKNIPIGGTSERHPDVDVFNYLGDMAIKLMFDAGVCLYNNKFVLICNNDFGPYIAKVISRLCTKLGVIDKAEKRNMYGDNIDWLGNFPDMTIPAEYRPAEAILFTAYPFDSTWIGGPDKPIQVKKLAEEFENPFVLRYAGDIDTHEMDKHNVSYYPANVAGGHMGILPSAIGIDPILRLQSGGLKVGELMLRNETHYKNKLLVELV